MRIGVFGCRAIPSTYSGYETFLTTLLPQLAQRGHEVTVYCRRGEADAVGDYRGVQRVFLPAIAGKRSSTLSHGFVASVQARFASHNVLLVVNVANALFCLPHKYSGRPVLLHVDGQEWLRGKWGPAARAFFLLSARVARISATGLIADCQAMADIFMKQFSSPSSVLPYCAPSEVGTMDIGVPASYGVSPDEYYLTGGRLNPENNIDGIAASYSAGAIDAPLLVLGTANYESPVASRLQALATEDPRIRLIGHVADRTTYLSLLGGARAYLHGHSVGGMNPSLVEAMAAGALVVALDTPFNRETLGPEGLYFDGGTGWVGDLRSALEATEAMSTDARQGLRSSAARRVAERFGLQDVASGYEELLLAAASCSSRRTLTITTRWSR